MLNVFVSGGAGYIGSHVCKALHRAGYRPITLDNLSRGNRWAVKWGPLEELDMTDRNALDVVFQSYRPKAVVHLAAFSYVDESIEKPTDYYHNNVTGTLTLLRAMLENSVDRIVFSSSCTVYGSPNTSVISEDHPAIPIHPYGASKLMVERMLADFRAAYGFRSLSLRYFNAAGADPEKEIGEVRDQDSRLIPFLLDVAAGRQSFAHVFGSDYDTPDGTCIRDYVHVSDIAEAHVTAIRALEGAHNDDVINLGNGCGHSVMEVVRMVRQVTGHKIPAKKMARKPGDAPRLVSDVLRAQQRLNWRPKHADLETMVQTAWNWKNHFKSIQA